MTRRRSNLLRAAPWAIAILGLVPLVILAKRLRGEGSAPLSAQAVLDPDTDWTQGYIEVQATERDPREPFFQGKVFLLVWRLDRPVFDTLTIVRSASRNYGSEMIQTPMVTEQTRTAMMSDATQRSIRMPAPHSLGLVTERHPSAFPFDSARFNFDLKLDPDIPLHLVRVRNVVPGFDLSKDVRVSRTPEHAIHVEFENRNPFIQAMCIFLGMTSIVFALIILIVTKTEALATSVASYFFSLWSVRGIVAPLVPTSPTFVDYWTVGVSYLLLIGLLARVAARKARS